MEPLKRKIGYDRKAGVADKAFQAPEKETYDNPKKGIKVFMDEAPKWKNPEDKRTRSEKVIEWFGSHELISINGVCLAAQIDTSNFNKLMKAGREIPEKILNKIEPIIKNYGYE